jgi:predicted secreted Zn-dependent protease
MPAPRILAFLAVLLAPLSPAAALEKCISPDGRISYGEQPCAAGSKRAPISGGAASVVGTAGVAASPYAAPVDLRLDYYEVQGADFKSVLSSMMAGREFAGNTHWSLSYEYRPRMAAGICKVDSVATRLELSMTLPHWAPPPGVAGELIARWERFISALRAHEDGHVQGAINLESEAKRTLLALSSESCRALDAAIRERFDQLLEQGRARDRDYDARTDHGNSQGAVFR